MNHFLPNRDSAERPEQLVDILEIILRATSNRADNVPSITKRLTKLVADIEASGLPMYMAPMFLRE